MHIKTEATIDGVKSDIQNESLEPEKKTTTFSFNELVKGVGRQSLKLIKWFLIVLLSVGLLNVVFFIIALFIHGKQPLNATSYGLLLIFLIGFICIAFALYNTYRYLLIDTLNVAYKYLTPLFKKVCVKIIDKVVAGGNLLIGKRDIEKMLNVGSLMIEVYGKKLPSYLQKSVMFILKRIPFSNFLFNMQDDLKNGMKDSKALSEILYDQLDTYIINTFFSNNSMKWIAWFLPLNIIMQIVLLIYFK